MRNIILWKINLLFWFLNTGKKKLKSFFEKWSVAYPYLLRDVARLTTPLKSRAPRTSLYLREMDLETMTFNF